MTQYNLSNSISAKNRGIAIPLDLENQVDAMFNKATILSKQTTKWRQASKTPKIERSQSQVIFIIFQYHYYLLYFFNVAVDEAR